MPDIAISGGTPAPTEHILEELQRFLLGLIQAGTVPSLADPFTAAGLIALTRDRIFMMGLVYPLGIVIGTQWVADQFRRGDAATLGRV